MATKIALAAIAAAMTAAAAEPSGQVYAFDNGYVLDMRRHTEGWMPGRVNDVKECSNARFSCFTSSGGDAAYATISVPRACTTFNTGDHWTMSGFTTRVLATTTIGVDSYALLQSDKSKAAFIYSRRAGIVGVAIIDTIIKRVRQNMLAGRYSLVGQGQLITFDPFWRCSPD